MSLFTTLVFSFFIIVLAITAMSVGVMAGRRPIKGSCGGLNSGGCELCSGSCRKKTGQEQVERENA